MNIEQALLKATKEKIRFATAAGNLTVEDLWDLPLTSTKAGISSLDRLVISYDQELSKQGETTSYVNKNPGTAQSTTLRAQREIALHILNYKMEAAQKAEDLRVKASQRELLTDLLHQKKLDEMKSLTAEEIEEKLKTLA